jgi:aminoglycoside phosphotransferase (APT) family kinase protein
MAETTGNNKMDGTNEESLAAWLEANIVGYRGPLSIERFKGGQSNPTFKLITPDKNYVLRRKPSGPLLKGAHAVEREARILSALYAVCFPVPKVHGLSTDNEVIGSWFYVMDMVEGRIFWDATFPDVGNAERPHYFNAMRETLARLHKLDYVGMGLSDFGHPGNYFQRQIARWSGQYAADVEGGRDPHMDKLIDWLPHNIPPGEESSIVHGDFRCDNMIFHPTEPRVIAVLDWELSTIGHPLADFAYHAMMYRMPPHLTAGLANYDLLALNIPSESEYIASYCRDTGRSEIPGYDFYVAFNLFRLAAIFHGIKARAIRGTAASPEALERAKALPELAELAWREAQKLGAR